MNLKRPAAPALQKPMPVSPYASMARPGGALRAGLPTPPPAPHSPDFFERLEEIYTTKTLLYFAVAFAVLNWILSAVFSVSAQQTVMAIGSAVALLLTSAIGGGLICLLPRLWRDEFPFHQAALSVLCSTAAMYIEKDLIAWMQISSLRVPAMIIGIPLTLGLSIATIYFFWELYLPRRWKWVPRGLALVLGISAGSVTLKAGLFRSRSDYASSSFYNTPASTLRKAAGPPRTVDEFTAFIIENRNAPR